MNAHHHYNPDWLTDDALLASFVARQHEFTFLRDGLARAPLTGGVQHYLLVGVRGAGKTTLLKRLAVAIRRDDDLRDHLIALSFPEELYQVKNLADFWWAACDALADALDALQRGAEADHLLDAVALARGGDRDNPSSDAGLQMLQQICARLQLRPVLLVDNLDIVFERIDKNGRKLKDPHAPAYWALREALSTSTSPIVIGGSVKLTSVFTDYDKAFYDFFMPKRLGKLSLDEVREVIERLADAQDAPEVKQLLRTRPSRIETLFDLTGGNPRALGLIFELLRNGPNSRAVQDFEHLMDLTTPYYKARIEDLSEQAQVIMHALAVRAFGAGDHLRFGHTAAEIGDFAGLPTSTVSTQLGILENEGLVEKSPDHGRTQYRIAEQLFRLWLQMRGTRRIRQNVIELTRFFEAMYDAQERHDKAIGEGAAQSVAAAQLAMSVADADAADIASVQGGKRDGRAPYEVQELMALPHAEIVRSYRHAAVQHSALDAFGITRQTDPHARFGAAAALLALDTGNQAGLRDALTRLIGSSVDIAAVLVSSHVVENFLAPALADNGAAEMVFAAMRSLGYEKHARPLMLAFEMAMKNRANMLTELEPELQAATRLMFQRLTAKPKVEKPLRKKAAQLAKKG